MSIEIPELKNLLTSFFGAVRDGIEPVESVSRHFVHPDIRLVAPDGTSFDIAAYRELHKGFLNEIHTLGDFDLIQICDDPERARAKGWVYFETKYRANPEGGMLKSVVGEEYILERGDDGDVRFVQYNSIFFATLPDSIPFDIG